MGHPTVLRRIGDPNFSFDESSNSSVFLTGKQVEAGRIKNTTPEVQAQAFEQRKSRSQLNEDHLNRWKERVKRFGFL
jgi:hypothetical protein